MSTKTRTRLTIYFWFTATMLAIALVEWVLATSTGLHETHKELFWVSFGFAAGMAVAPMVLNLPLSERVPDTEV